MRVLLGFQILPAEALNWNLEEESDLAFRGGGVGLTVETVFFAKNLFLRGGSQNN